MEKKKELDFEMIRIGKKIKKIMESHNKSVNEVADELGVTPNAIRNYLNGYNRPSSTNMMKLAKILNSSLNEIFDVEGGDGK